MILPDNGKIVIIDDKEKDVKPLILALKKEKMPFLFFTDQAGDDLPENGPISNVRLVFLDLDLGIGDSSDAKQKIRIVQERLVSLIQPNNPYLLVIWSTHEDTLLKLLLDDFKGSFKDYAPILNCSFDKQETLHNGQGDPIQIIRAKLKNELGKFEAFNVFLFWESIVSNSSGEIVNGFTRIFELDEIWNNNVKAFLYRLAKSNVGSPKIDNINDREKLQLALETITSALTDSIENNLINDINKVNFTVKEEGANITQKHLTEINTKLHFINSSNFEHFQPGNVYLIDLPDKKMIINIVLNSFEKKFIDEIIKSKPKIIKVDVTPACDYSQDKGYTRLLSGILVNEKFYDKRKRSVKASIYNLCPVITAMGENYYPVFDFRYFKSMTQEAIKDYFPKAELRIRTPLIVDLQAGLSNHINRPGIVTII